MARSIKDYTKLYIGDPDHRNLPVGTNEKKTVKLIAKSISDLAKGLAKDKRKITISGITPRNEKWNDKAGVVNDQLKGMIPEALKPQNRR